MTYPGDGGDRQSGANIGHQTSMLKGSDIFILLPILLFYIEQFGLL